MKYASVLSALGNPKFYHATAIEASPRFPMGDAYVAVAQFWFPDFDSAESAARTALGGHYLALADKVYIFACQYHVRPIESPGSGDWKTVPIAAVSPESALRVLGACLSLAGAWYHEARLASKRPYRSMRAYLIAHHDDGLPPAAT